MKSISLMPLLACALLASGCPGGGTTPEMPEKPTGFSSAKLILHAVSNYYKDLSAADFPASTELTVFVVSEESDANSIRARGQNPRFIQSPELAAQWVGAAGSLVAEMPNSVPRDLYDRGDAFWASNTYIVLKVSQPGVSPQYFCPTLQSASFDGNNPTTNAAHFYVDIARYQSVAPQGAQVPAHVLPLFCEGNRHFNLSLFFAP